VTSHGEWLEFGAKARAATNAIWRERCFGRRAMRSHFVLTALVLAGVVSTARARADEPRPPSHVVAAGLNVGMHTFRDDILVPRASTGPGVALSGRFLGTFRESIVDTGLRVGFATVFDRDARIGFALWHDLRVGWLPVVHASRTGWSFAVGPLLAWETDVAQLPKWDDAHAYWLARRWIGPSARAWRLVSRDWRVDVSAESSLCGFESRPAGYRYNKQDALTHPDFYFAGVNRDAQLGWLYYWQAARVSVDVSRARVWGLVPHGWSFGVETRLAHTSQPATAFVLETSARLAYAWGLR
jgi:hypothetical protein